MLSKVTKVWRCKQGKKDRKKEKPHLKIRVTHCILTPPFIYFPWYSVFIICISFYSLNLGISASQALQRTGCFFRHPFAMGWDTVCIWLCPEQFYRDTKRRCHCTIFSVRLGTFGHTTQPSLMSALLVWRAVRVLFRVCVECLQISNGDIIVFDALVVHFPLPSLHFKRVFHSTRRPLLSGARGQKHFEFFIINNVNHSYFVTILF